MLPHVVRWNSAAAAARYHELIGHPDGPGASTEALASRLEELRRAGGLPERLAVIGVGEADLEGLAGEAGEQWTGRFNPRDWTATGALEVYRQAL